MAYKRTSDQFLWDVFRVVDRDRSGSITANELERALSNGTWQPFNSETVRMMIGMFDKDHSGTINFEEFKVLWKYLTDWLKCFRNFDTDHSGNIDRNELKNALTTFGYRLSDGIYDLIVQKFDRAGTQTIIFDDFIQCCVHLQKFSICGMTLTAAFKYHDTDMDGFIRISYEDFLRLVFSLRM